VIERYGRFGVSAESEEGESKTAFASAGLALDESLWTSLALFPRTGVKVASSLSNVN
jgi:hypothetical protein